MPAKTTPACVEETVIPRPPSASPRKYRTLPTKKLRKPPASSAMTKRHPMNCGCDGRNSQRRVTSSAPKAKSATGIWRRTDPTYGSTLTAAARSVMLTKV
jgi:hypothetical protein